MSSVSAATAKSVLLTITSRLMSSGSLASGNGVTSSPGMEDVTWLSGESGPMSRRKRVILPGLNDDCGSSGLAVAGSNNAAFA